MQAQQQRFFSGRSLIRRPVDRKNLEVARMFIDQLAMIQENPWQPDQRDDRDSERATCKC
jgi:hypothetical protein